MLSCITKYDAKHLQASKNLKSAIKKICQKYKGLCLSPKQFITCLAPQTKSQEN
jgi:hypothetical protein